MALAMCPKEEWLILHGVDAEWPIWGRPKLIVTDNGPEFQSRDFERAMQKFGIDMEFRPVGLAHFGGHVERVQGTLLREIHDLPGTTFANIAERKEYDSEGRAVMTLGEFERQLLKLICNEYHRRPHSSIGMPPLRKWELGIFGSADSGGIGMPPRPGDRTEILLNFLPSFERTIQNDGVSLENLRYYDDCLRPWIGMLDDETERGRRHLFRRDPRDVSKIWFFDPDLKVYFKVPLADASAPSFSVWEHRRAKEAVAELGYDPSDERVVIQSIRERREMVADSAKKTKKARREHQRNRDHQRALTVDKPLAKAPSPAGPESAPSPENAAQPALTVVSAPTAAAIAGLAAFVAPPEDIA
jgi:putative transposase